MFFANQNATPSTGLQTTSGLPDVTTSSGDIVTSDPTGGQDFLALLLSVQSIKLNDSFFTSKAFTTLQDFNRPIPPDTNPGRTAPNFC